MTNDRGDASPGTRATLTTILIACAVLCALGVAHDVMVIVSGRGDGRMVTGLIVCTAGLCASAVVLRTRRDWR